MRLRIGPGFTAFVGANNAGKSTALRLLYEFRHHFSACAKRDTLERAIQGGIGLPYGETRDSSEILTNANLRDLSLECRIAVPREEGIAATTLEFDVARQSSGTVSVAVTGPRFGRLEQLGVRPSAGHDGQVLAFSAGSSSGVHLIQVGDVLSAAKSLCSTLYIGSFRNALDLSSEDRYFDIQVGRPLIKTWQQMKTSDAKAAIRVTQEVERVIASIFGVTRLDIHASHDGSTFRVVIDDEPYRMQELGSGMAHFIVTLANAAIARPEWILIDEPELGLHPSLQVDFLTTLGAFASKGVLFSTHSMGLARAVATRIYSVQRERGKSRLRPLEATPNLVELLGAMSYSSHQELGYEGVLLVEGATDVTTFMQFLRHYGKDHKVVLVPMGGDALINPNTALQLREVLRLAPKVWAIIDSEKPNEGAALKPSRQGFVDTCRGLGIPCHVLERRATENYLTQAAVQSVRGANGKALDAFDGLDPKNGWSKADNWRMARAMSRADLDVTDLGRFLAGL